jgi:predicted Rossmann fold nucleotide-binding protein DprA/Smf involved in DNA uptake
MHYVTQGTAIARGQVKDVLVSEAPRRAQQRDEAGPLRHGRAVRQVRAALALAERPVRARALAHDLDLPTAEVTAELRHLQDVGVVVSHDRRWAVVGATQSQ